MGRGRVREVCSPTLEPIPGNGGATHRAGAPCRKRASLPKPLKGYTEKRFTEEERRLFSRRRGVFFMPKYVVRYGAMRFLGVFATRGNEKYKRAARVIARTNRGLEAGEILCEATDEAVRYLKDPPSGQILRGMTAEDDNELDHLKAHEGHEFQTCQQLVQRLGLDMQLVDFERVFGGERVVVYYLAEQRVDFRGLVKELANELQTRIEMRQIGVRDEAKLLADYGDCGKPVCCNTYLSAMPPVSMKRCHMGLGRRRGEGWRGASGVGRGERTRSDQARASSLFRGIPCWVGHHRRRSRRLGCLDRTRRDGRKSIVSSDLRSMPPPRSPAPATPLIGHRKRGGSCRGCFGVSICESTTYAARRRASSIVAEVGRIPLDFP